MKSQAIEPVPMLDCDILAKIIDVSPIPAFVVDRQHRVIHWNAALETLTRIRKDEIIGTDGQWRAFYPEKRPVMADLIIDGAPDEVLASYYRGHRSDLLRGAYQFEQFFRSLGKGGKWFFITVNPVRNEDSSILAVIETLEDVTARKRAERKLRHSEQNYRTLFQSALDAIWVHDAKGRIRMANPAASALTGYATEELLGRNVNTLFSGEDLDPPQRGLAGGRHELMMIRKDGREAVCMVTTNVIAGEGKRRLFQNIARDITEDKRLQDNLRYYLKKITQAQEEERRRIARELHDDTLQTLNFLSRELGTFIHKKRGDLPPDDRQFLANLQAQVNQGVDNLQRFSQALRLSVLDDFGLVPALRSLLKTLQDDGIHAELKVTGSEKRLPAETETLLFRVVQEAFSNIRKHAQATQAWLQLDFTPDKIKVTVKDNGKGFELPDRLDELPRRDKLGLVGMEERIRLLGGSFEITSAPNQGTTIVAEVRV